MKPNFNWTPKRVTSTVKAQVNNFVDKALPYTAPLRSRKSIVSARINGETFEEDEAGHSIQGGDAHEISQANNNPSDFDKPLTYPVLKATKDIIGGVRALFIANLALAIWYFVGFATLLIYRCVIVALGTTKILTVFLTTSFSLYNQPSALGGFYPIVSDTSNYLIDIPLLVVLGVAMAACVARLLSIYWSGGLFKSDDVKSNAFTYNTFDIHTAPSTTDPSKTVLVVKRMTSDFAYYFDEDIYTKHQLANFYLKQVFDGAFWFRWIEWAIDGGSLLWALMTLSPIQDIFLLVTMLMLFLAILALAYLHEHMNRVKDSNIDLAHPIGYIRSLVMGASGSNHAVKKRSIKWWALVLATLGNLWLWTVVYFYYGYADNFNPGSYQWFRLAVIPIAFAFYFLFVPITMLVWSLVGETHYFEFEAFTPHNINEAAKEMGYPDVTSYVNDPNNHDSEGRLKVFQSSGYWTEFLNQKMTYFDATPQQRQRIHDYFHYQNWNKNYIYEIAMLVEAALCKTLVIWILWGGMLSQ